MMASEVIERIGHILINHPNLLSQNDDILKKYGIDFRECSMGSGIDVLAYFDLEQRMNTLLEMGMLDEVKKNKAESLELIRNFFMKLNFKEVKNKKDSIGLC